MSMYSYLCSVERNQSCYHTEVSWYEKVCVWALHNLWGAHYWKDVALKQSAFLKEDRKRNDRKLTNALNAYAAHIGEPAYSMLWGSLKMSEERDVVVQTLPNNFTEPLYIDMDDAEFMHFMKQQEEMTNG